MATTFGTNSDDTLPGTLEEDRIWGLAGHDNLDGREGNDFLYGGAGDDVLTSASGHDRLEGGAGDDRLVLIGTSGALTGGAGLDTLVVDLSDEGRTVFLNGTNGHGTVGYQTNTEEHTFFREIERFELTTGNGDDWVNGGSFDDVISTGVGNDLIGQPWPALDDTASALGADVVDAGAGADTIIDRIGANRLFGGTGDDSIAATLSSAELDGGEGSDTLRLEEAESGDDLALDFASGTASSSTIIRNFEHAVLETGSGDDRLNAAGLSSVEIASGAGDDQLEGSPGDDTISADDGSDLVHGGAGADLIQGNNGNDHIEGGLGNDELWGDSADYSSQGDDSLFGGAGDDALNGGSGSDRLSGGNDNDQLHGGRGDDTLFGNAGDDWLSHVYAGYDRLDGGAGNDGFGIGNTDGHALEGEIDGGEGRDWLRLTTYGATGPVEFDAATGSFGGLSFVNVEDFEVEVRDSSGLDHTLRGSDGEDTLVADAGDDVLAGRSGNDTLRGGAGSDRVDGGAGDDRLEGGDFYGSDLLTGGAGADAFVWNDFYIGHSGIDRITDFDTESDDVIRFEQAGFVYDYDDFLAASRGTPDGVYFAIAGRDDYGILIEGVSLSDLSTDDIVFS
ncbi:calcium-binding protein [Bosea sp. F3-2]|uniref:calcium-binding protein n=1 Tax=Bosea sp. F3-2 TaxID=2599640 RepID=UPI0011EDE79F|nr:calcium-binding protein [Bosea sp. F3-2]QEL22697.1 calcium-binding protein [Bosea sp. F3-2]